MLIDELHIQCMLFQRAFAHLEDAADHWIKLARGEDFDRKVPPLDILNWCTACLSAMAAIRRLVAAGQPNAVADYRRKVLREFLKDPTLTHVCSATVRNAWEHLDERMDRIIPHMTSGSVSHIYVAADPPGPGAVTLKRFDPVGFSISFTDEVIPLRPAAQEIAALLGCLDDALKRLANEVVAPWPHDVRVNARTGA
jgi:hypothetical protein